MTAVQGERQGQHGLLLLGTLRGHLGHGSLVLLRLHSVRPQHAKPGRRVPRNDEESTKSDVNAEICGRGTRAALTPSRSSDRGQGSAADKYRPGRTKCCWLDASRKEHHLVNGSAYLAPPVLLTQFDLVIDPMRVDAKSTAEPWLHKAAVQKLRCSS